MPGVSAGARSMSNPVECDGPRLITPVLSRGSSHSTWSCSVGAGGEGADLVGEAGPQVPRQVVAHSLEADELRAGDGFGDGLAAGDVDQRVVETVHNQRRHVDVAQVPGAVGLTDTSGELAK